MRFSTLLRKELRESLPWMLLAAIIFLAMAGFVLREQAYFRQLNWYDSSFASGSVVEPYRLTPHSSLSMTGPYLIFISIGLGLVLGVRHFWIPHFTRTWPFLLHRSVNRQVVLAAKLTAAAVAFVAST